MAAEKVAYIILEFVDKATAGMQKAVTGIQGAIENISRSFGKLIDDAKYASTAILASFTLIAKKAVDTAMEFEKTRVAAEFLTNSSEAADKFAKSIREIALATPLGIDQIASFGKIILGQTRDVDLADRALRGLIDATSATGGGYLELQGATRAWIQTLIKAKPSLEELNRQFTNAHIPVLKILAKYIASGEVSMGDYTGQVIKSLGPTKQQTTAFQKASDSLGIYEKQVKAAKLSLKRMKDSGKATEEQILRKEIALDKANQTLNKARGSIDGYNSALESSKGSAVVFHRSAKEIESDLQDISELGVTGEEAAMAILQALELEYKGAAERMTNTLSGQLEKAGDSFKVFAATVIGIEENLEVRKGSIFYYLKEGVRKLNEVLPLLTEKAAEFFDTLLKNKTTLLAIAGMFAGLYISVGKAALVFLAPALKLMLIFGLIGAALGLVIEKLGGMETIIDRAKELWGGLGEKFKEAKQKLGEFGLEIMGLAGVVLPSWETFKVSADSLLVQPFREAIDKIKADLLGLRDFQVSIPIGELFSEEVKKGFEEAKEVVKLAFESIFNAFKKSLEPIWESFKTSLKEMMPLIQQWADIFAQIAPPILKILGIILAALFGLVVGVLAVGATIITGILTALAEITDRIAQFVTGVVQLFTGLFNLVYGIVTLDGQKIKEAFRMIWQGIKNIFEGFIMGIIEGIGGFVKGVITFFENLYKALVGGSIIPDLIDAIINLFKNLDDEVLKIVSGLIESIKSKFTTLVSNAYNWGKNLISNWWSGVKEAAGSLPEAAFGKAKEAFGLQHGGIVPGPIGAPVPAIVHGGERIIPRGSSTYAGAGVTTGGGGIIINMTGPIVMDSEERTRQLAEKIVKIMGRSNELAKYGVGF